jgi:hypothetical protein
MILGIIVWLVIIFAMTYVACPILAIVFLVIGVIGAIYVAIAYNKAEKHHKKVMAQLRMMQPQQPEQQDEEIDYNAIIADFEPEGYPEDVSRYCNNYQE